MGATKWCDTIKQIWHKYVKHMFHKHRTNMWTFIQKTFGWLSFCWNKSTTPQKNTTRSEIRAGHRETILATLRWQDIMGMSWGYIEIPMRPYYPQKMYWDVLGYIEIPMSWGCIGIYQAPKKMRMLVTSDFLPRKWKNPDLWNISSIPRFWWLNQLFLCYEFWSFNIATWPIYSWST